MTNYDKLRAMAIAAQQTDDHYITRSISATMLANAASPGTVLGLLDKIESLQKDANRYQWLLENADLMHWENMLGYADLEGAESINQAIDAAICSPENH